MNNDPEVNDINTPAKIDELDIDQVCSIAINRFVNHMIGAFESGFVEYPYIDLATLHRIQQNYAKDTYGIDMPHITEEWGESVAILCGYGKEDKG